MRRWRPEGGEPGAAVMLAALLVLGAVRAADARCARPDAWCDGTPDCPDGADEPPGCTPCNRTYSGLAGVQYSLNLPRPVRAPFLCHLTFAAGGGAAGDVVQLALDEFRVGRYAAGARDACPDGRLTLAELGRPYTGGSWCGQAAGAALYFSETPTVTATLRLARTRLGDPFAFSLRYKFISQRDAIVRFGAGAGVERGAVSPGTYCTRTFDECHRKHCTLQSPNYPGMYPRNVSCYWSVRQRSVPTCKHAMVAVRQDHAHKMHIKRSISMARLNATARGVRAWSACGGERDRIIFYDGATTDDPVLLEFCGGDWLPRVAARGPDMLVAFHSAPFSAPPPPLSQNHPLRGFELDVEVVFADSDSLDYVREARRCEFHVKAPSADEEWESFDNETNAILVNGAEGLTNNIPSSGSANGRSRRGIVRSPQHTLPPGTACSWTFHGRPTDRIWLYFSSFTHYSLLAPANETDIEDEGVTMATVTTNECEVGVTVKDGDTEVARHCDSVPRLCARASLGNATRWPRPCAPPDAYVSSAALLALSVTSRSGTATHPLRFVMHYEFLDAALLGDPLPLTEAASLGAEPAECARLLASEGSLWSPRNTLWFGAGGARSLRCVLRLAAGAANAVLRLATSLGPTNSTCDTKPHPLTQRPTCRPRSASAMLEDDDYDVILDDVPHLMIYEMPWPGYRVPLACICDNTTSISASGYNALELRLTLPAMRAQHSPRNTHYRGTWRRRAASCAHHTHTPHHLYFSHPPSSKEAACVETPWLLLARGNHSVALRLWGTVMLPRSECHTQNRLLVYSPDGRLLRAVCPGSTEENAPTELIVSSSGSGAESGAGGGALLLVWKPAEPGHARISWMPVWRSSGPLALLDSGTHNDTASCAAPCAALAACMPVRMWCDGYIDCPGGADEHAEGGCGASARLVRGLRSAGAAGLAAATGALLLVLLLLHCWRRRRRLPHKPRAARLPDDLTSDASTLS